jgi:ribosome recycling factor
MLKASRQKYLSEISAEMQGATKEAAKDASEDECKDGEAAAQVATDRHIVLIEKNPTRKRWR